ncbi:MAG: NUDIX hydrolase [bacterium]|nr:NUDIX hydrolase [bacterium]
MDHLKEIGIKSDRYYEGRIVNLRKDTVRLADGSIATREIVEHAPAAVILPVFDDGRVALIYQYRRAVDEIMLEAPAGIIDPGEDTTAAALRELQEETGYIAGKMTPLLGAYLTPGFCDEFMHFYLAEDLSLGDTDFDEDERIETVIVTWDDLNELIVSGKIRDGKTIVAFLMAKAYLNK